MIIGKRRLKQIKLILVSPALEKITVLSYLLIIPLMLLYETYGLGQGTLNLYQFNKQFQIDVWQNCTSMKEAFSYLTNIFTPKYYALQFKASHIPLQKLIIAQTRSTIYLCEQNELDCEYGLSNYQIIPFEPLDVNNCVTLNCSEFQQSTQVFDGIQIGVDGHYQTYYDFYHFATLNITDNYSNFYDKIFTNQWVDNYTESIGIFGSVFDIDSQQQVQIILLLEQQYSKYPLYFSTQLFQLPFQDFSDPIHITLFSYLIFIGLLKIFRTMLELTYIFSKFNFFFQLYNFTALIIYCIEHFQILIIRDSAKEYNLLFSKSIMESNFIGKILPVGSALMVNDQQIIEDVGKVLLLLSYPYSFLQFILFFNVEWVQNYHTLQMRTIPGLLVSTILSISFYVISFLPQILLDREYRTQHHSINFVAYFFASLFLDNYQAQEQRKVLSQIVEAINFLFQGIIIVYVIGLSIEGFRKASIIEMPYISKYEKEFIIHFENLNVKINKVLKQVQKLFIKEKQSKDKKIIRREDDKQSQILDDEELLSEFQELKDDKILIVFEINNAFLEDINRFKARRDANLYAQKRIKYNKQNKEPGSNQKIRIIQSLLQKDKVNSRLQVMLSKHQNNEAQYAQLQEDQVESHEDFFLSFKDQISEQGVKIREFTVIDQVIKFLEMLLRLRPEFLSLNAEQRIRIMFYINSDQVEEEDVYKLLSFLIVNLAKQHLNYPILVFSCHKEWYIEKEQYLKLKKFYRNIFSTLEKECALEFSLMKTSFFDFQIIFSKDQQFYEKDNQEEISNSMIEEGEDKSELL